jgi:elongation factor Ts
LEQNWIRDESKKIKDLISEYIAKFDENIIVGRFARFQI